MKASLRQSMSWLHTWSGLLFGWLLFTMFVTGTAAYFNEEITRWMQPELKGRAAPAEAVEGALRYLERTAPDAKSWFISPPGRRTQTTNVFWQPADDGGEKRRRRRDTSAQLDSDGNKVEARDTRGGFFLYRFHFDLHYMPVIWARYLVGLAAMFMLVAIVSGVITHKKIFTDFFMLRFGKGQRSWLDTHNVTAVLALPFHLMITYTGLVTLATLYMPWGIAATYQSSDSFFEARFPSREEVERQDRPAPLAPIAPMMAAARTAWNGAPVGSIRIANPGDASARISLTRASEASIASRGETLEFNGVTGAPITPVAAGLGGAALTESTMIGLHAGRYAHIGLRWLYFLSGLGGIAMVGTGLVLWTVKRRQKLPDPTRPHLGFRIVEKLNVATVAGFPASLAGYFLANRLLPLRMEARADWEVHAMFMLWTAFATWAILRPARRGWVEILGAGALLFASVPIVNLMTTERGIVHSLIHGDLLFIGFDAAMLVCAALFALAARKAAHKRAEPRQRVRPTPAAKLEAVA